MSGWRLLHWYAVACGAGALTYVATMDPDPNVQAAAWCGLVLAWIDIFAPVVAMGIQSERRRGR